MFSPNFDLILNLADRNASGRLALDGSKVVSTTAKPGRLIRNDAGIARVRACLPSTTAERQFDDVDLSDATVRIGLGTVDQLPTSGTFPLAPIAAQTTGPIISAKRYIITSFVAGDSFLNVGATVNATGNMFVATGTTPTTWTNGSALQEITADLDIDATYAEVQTALNATAAITALGGVTVTGSAGKYRVVFSAAVGAQVAISGPLTVNMSPPSVVSVSRVQIGTSVLHEVQSIRLIALPYCFATLSTAFPVAASSVTEIQAATSRVPETERLTLDPQPYAGTFLFTLDGNEFEAPFDATEAQIASMIGPAYTVVHRALNSWDISGAEAAQAIAITAVDVSKLRVPIGVSGSMPMNTVGMAQAFTDNEAKMLRFTLEVEIQFDGQDSQKVYQEIVEVHRDLIDLNSVAPAVILGMTFVASQFSSSLLIYSNLITALRSGPFSLEAFSTTALALDTLHFILINGYPQGWILQAGAANAGDPTGEVAPLDYNALTNDKHWELSGL